jgi:hypothetical protein
LVRPLGSSSCATPNLLVGNFQDSGVLSLSTAVRSMKTLCMSNVNPFPGVCVMLACDMSIRCIGMTGTALLAFRECQTLSQTGTHHKVRKRVLSVGVVGVAQAHDVKNT